MSKLKYCYAAYGLFHDILKMKPMMSGCYQWIRVFDGTAMDYINMDDPEKFDVIMVNLDWSDWRIIVDLRLRLGKSSSTIVVANQDYSPEGFKKGYAYLDDFRFGIEIADRCFATTPAGQRCMQMLTKKKIHMIPHPIETHAIKRIYSTVFYPDKWGVYFHRYTGENFTPIILARHLGIKPILLGYLQREDEQFRRTKSSFTQVVPYVDYVDMLKITKELAGMWFLSQSYTWGRMSCDTACLRVPCIVSDTISSSEICYPLTKVDTYDLPRIAELTKRLMTDESFRQEVIDIAHYNVEYFGYKRSKDRFMEMIEHESSHP